MNIVFNCDNNYAPYLAVAISSLIQTQKQKLNFYILDIGISAESKKKLLELVHGSRNEITFIEINPNDFCNFPKTIEYISVATYCRLKIADYLSILDKVLYLDIDIFVNQDLTELWNTNLENNAIAACYDPFIETHKPEYKATIGLEHSHYYINAGVLLINIEKWKSIDVIKRAIEYLSKYSIPRSRYT